MNIPQLVKPVVAVPRLRFRIFSSSLFLLALALPGSSVSAQSLAARPVARLIGETPTYSSPRNVGTSTAGTTKPASPSLSEATQPERRAFEVTNQERVKNGLAPLSWDHELCRMARAHSQAMAKQGFFSHETPEGLRLRDRALATGIPRFRVLGENIAYNQGFKDPGAFAVERWMVSPGHRANILSKEYESSAVGVFVTPDGIVYLTQVFITR